MKLRKANVEAQNDPSQSYDLKGGGYGAVAVWSLRLVWTVSPAILLTLGALVVVLGVLPAGLALTVRGLVDAAVSLLDQAQPRVSPLLPWLALAFGLSLVEAIGYKSDTYLKKRLTDELNLRTTTDILRHASALDVAFFEDSRQRDLVAKAQASAAGQLVRFVTEILLAATNLLRAISLIGLLAFIEPLVLVVVPPFAVPFLLFQWKLAKDRYAEENSRATKRRWTSYFVSQLTGPYSVGEAKLLELGPLLVDKFTGLMREFRDRDRKLHLRNFVGSSVAAALTIVAVFAVFLRVAGQTVVGASSLGDLAVFAGATARLRFALDGAISAGTVAFEQVLFISNLSRFMQVKPGISASGRLQPSLDGGELDLRNVTFAYPGSSKPVLKNLSLRIAAGETLALVGENGAGKTTLVKLLARFYDPDDGEILFDGIDLREIRSEHLHRRISLLPQSFGRYEATIADNIAYGDWRKLRDDHTRIEWLSKTAGLHEKVESLPEKYDTVIGRSFGTVNLSGGQWQKIALARVLAKDASLLVLDEPTSSLDARGEYEVFCKFRELAKGRTTVLVSHRFTTLGMADRIAVLAEGRIVELGTHEELLELKKVYSSLYDLYEKLAPTKRATRSSR